jgi:hypothetical protein
MVIYRSKALILEPNVMKRNALILFVLIGLLPLMSLARVEKAENSGTFSFYLENDFFFQMDRYYTSGVKLSWISPDLREDAEGLRLARWFYSLFKGAFFVDRPEFQHAVSFSIGNDMYTPEDLSRSDLIVTERPYAGMTYIGIGFHNKSSRHMSTLEFDLGIVGPYSFTETFQKTIHNVFDYEYPNGWDHQLGNEPALRVIYDHKWKLLKWQLGGDFGFDWIAYMRGGLGNVYTGAGLGMEVRWGFTLPDDFGTFPIRPGGDVTDIKRRSSSFSRQGRFGIHVFAAVEGQAVLRDIFLDGNTFRDSHSVDKEPFVADLMVGISLRINRFKLFYSRVYLTRRFKVQFYKQRYGSINLSFSY